jgi:pyruvate-formate lyase-activating enzyme
VEPPGEYVYVVRSRRTGAISIGVDLTPEGACPFACDYCQVDGARSRTPRVDVDLGVLGRELDAALERHPHPGDVTFAGSGEPTWSPAFREALAQVRTRASARGIDVVVYTSGALFGRAPIRDALAALVRAGEGRVWVKLDTWDEESMLRIAGVRGHALHEERIVSLAREVEIGVQTLVAHRPDGFSVEETAAGLASVVRRFLVQGARIGRLQLTTILRPPGVDWGLEAYSAGELAIIADAIRRERIAVRVVEIVGGE